jgi:hypothetical protein
MCCERIRIELLNCRSDRSTAASMPLYLSILLWHAKKLVYKIRIKSFVTLWISLQLSGRTNKFFNLRICPLSFDMVMAFECDAP